MSHPSIARLLALAVLCVIASRGAIAQVPPQSTAQELPLFAVEIKVGPKWDQSKPPQDQQHFREHSANLKRLREAGSLIMGARYSDKGLVVLTATDEVHARAMMDDDPAMRSEIFKYEIHPLSVFYSGTLSARPRPAAPQ